ncbi:MAG: dual specificity protein phosphatase [Chloroflexota bacterium]
MPDLKHPEPDLHHPEVPEVVATRKDAVHGSSLSKRLQHLLQMLRKQGPILTMLEGVEQSIRLITGAPTRRFSQISPNLHVGGQHTRRGLLLLTNRGITAVVSMRREMDDREQGIAPPHYLYLPTVDNHAPTLEHLNEGVKFISTELQNGGSVYVHCWEGVGRAPTMVAAYLISTGLSPDQAWERIRNVRPFIRPVESQINQIERFAAFNRG